MPVLPLDLKHHEDKDSDRMDDSPFPLSTEDRHSGNTCLLNEWMSGYREGHVQKGSANVYKTTPHPQP